MSRALHILAKSSPIRGRVIRAYAFREGIAPPEIQLWNVGDNATDYGVHKWTDRSARVVMDQYASRGNPIQVDVEHNNAAALPDAAAQPQGGYARLEIRSGAPWLVFDWSAYAIEQIETRQRLFISPEYLTDEATGEIVRLIRVSLVADPGTHHARQLATSKDRKMNLALIIAALRAALSAEDPEVAKTQIANLLAEIEKMSGGASDAGDGAGDPPAEQTDAGAGDAGMSGGGDDDTTKKKAAADAGGGAPGDDEAKKKAAAADPTKCKAQTSIQLAQRVAELEHRDTQRNERELQLEAGARVAAHAVRIPESLHAFALKLSKEDFETFVKGLPAAPAKGTIRAAARAATGRDDQNSTTDEGGSGALPDETKKHLARAFSEGERPAESVLPMTNGRVKLTHMSRPKSQPAAGNGKA